MTSDPAVARRYAVLRPQLEERQRRLVLAAELGRGGIKAGVLEGGAEPPGRVAGTGGWPQAVQ